MGITFGPFKVISVNPIIGKATIVDATTGLQRKAPCSDVRFKWQNTSSSIRFSKCAAQQLGSGYIEFSFGGSPTAAQKGVVFWAVFSGWRWR